MTTGAIIQARTSSTRLPGKVLKELPYGSGITVLEQIIRRLKQCQLLDKLILATTIDVADHALVQIAEKEKIPWYQGSKENLLSRYVEAAKQNHLDTVIRITSDCPCIDPAVVDQVIEHHHKTASDFTSTALKERTFPHGIEVEAFSFGALEQSYKLATKDSEKEHINLYIQETNPEHYRIASIQAEDYIKRPQIRITLDTPEDYTLLCAVFDYLYPRNQFFDTAAIVRLFDRKPWLYAINHKGWQKKIFNTLEEELTEAEKILDLQELTRAKQLIQQHKQSYHE